MFESLSDRLTGALQGLRGKGRLTDADIDATTREIRLALLEADVSLPVVRDVRRTHQGTRQGCRGVGRAQSGPAGRQDRQRRNRPRSSASLASRRSPIPCSTVIMLAGLQGSGKTNAGRQAREWGFLWTREYVLSCGWCCDLQRPCAVMKSRSSANAPVSMFFARHPACRAKVPSRQVLGTW